MTLIGAIAEAMRQGRFTETRLADGSAMLLDVERFKVSTLNSTAAEILAAIRNGAGTAEEIAMGLAREFDIDLETALVDTRAFVADLAARLR